MELPRCESPTIVPPRNTPSPPLSTTTDSESENQYASKTTTSDLSNQSDDEPGDVQGAPRQGDVNPVGAGRVRPRGRGRGRGVGRGRGLLYVLPQDHQMVEENFH